MSRDSVQRELHPRPLRVECYSGYRGEEYPQRIVLADRVVSVRVLDRWLSPDHRDFKVLDEEGCIYLVRHDVAEGQWFLNLYEEPLR